MEDQVKQEHKLATVPFREGTEKTLKDTNPIIRENFRNIYTDFIKIYNNALSTENLTEEQVSQIKSDLFISFCYGLLIGSDMQSVFRKGFILPKEMDPSKQIITPSQNLKKPNSGIIL